MLRRKKFGSGYVMKEKSLKNRGGIKFYSIAIGAPLGYIPSDDTCLYFSVPLAIILVAIACGVAKGVEEGLAGRIKRMLNKGDSNYE